MSLVLNNRAQNVEQECYPRKKNHMNKCGPAFYSRGHLILPIPLSQDGQISANENVHALSTGQLLWRFNPAQK